ncbi:hypothetical protein DENSPDRAFT_831902 [Dentipellis sp. KUC8613]|nr:hypothetical protein DENSPDRAFT_831902 [Dentipellis sp. KUC8613]
MWMHVVKTGWRYVPLLANTPPQNVCARPSALPSHRHDLRKPPTSCLAHPQLLLAPHSRTATVVSHPRVAIPPPSRSSRSSRASHVPPSHTRPAIACASAAVAGLCCCRLARSPCGPRLHCRCPRCRHPRLPSLASLHLSRAQPAPFCPRPSVISQPSICRPPAHSPPSLCTMSGSRERDRKCEHALVAPLAFPPRPSRVPHTHRAALPHQWDRKRVNHTAPWSIWI